MMTNRFIQFVNRHSLTGLRISLGLCFLWFGALKFIPGCSPACEIASTTIERLSFGLIGEPFSIYFLAIFESLIGLSLIFRVFLKVSLFMLIGHMIFTFSTFFVVPEMVIGERSLSLTLEGQYVVKNAVFIFAALVILAKSFEKRMSLTQSEGVQS